MWHVFDAGAVWRKKCRLKPSRCYKSCTVWMQLLGASKLATGKGQSSIVPSHVSNLRLHISHMQSDMLSVHLAVLSKHSAVSDVHSDAYSYSGVLRLHSCTHMCTQISQTCTQVFQVCNEMSLVHTRMQAYTSLYVAGSCGSFVSSFT